MPRTSCCCSRSDRQQIALISSVVQILDHCLGRRSASLACGIVANIAMRQSWDLSVGRGALDRYQSDADGCLCFPWEVSPINSPVPSLTGQEKEADQHAHASPHVEAFETPPEAIRSRSTFSAHHLEDLALSSHGSTASIASSLLYSITSAPPSSAHFSDDEPPATPSTFYSTIDTKLLDTRCSLPAIQEYTEEDAPPTTPRACFTDSIIETLVPTAWAGCISPRWRPEEPLPGTPLASPEDLHPLPFAAVEPHRRPQRPLQSTPTLADAATPAFTAADVSGMGTAADPMLPAGASADRDQHTTPQPADAAPCRALLSRSTGGSGQPPRTPARDAPSRPPAGDGLHGAAYEA
eukprot:jgi/Ulvmu1/4292/UM002_0012.1